MAAFITTMFVAQSPSPLMFPTPPKHIPPSFNEPPFGAVADCRPIEGPALIAYGQTKAGAEAGFQKFLRCASRVTTEQSNGQGLSLADMLQLRIDLKAMMESTEKLLDHFEEQLYEHLSLLADDHRNSRTRAPFKPNKAGRGTSSWQLKQFAEATLGSGSLRKAVKLPEGEDLNEWLAVNSTSHDGLCTQNLTLGYELILSVAVVDFYNQVNLLYGSITEFCSPQSCPEMKATDE